APLPSTAVPDPPAGAAASAPSAVSQISGAHNGLDLLLGIGLLCAGLLAAWGIALKLLHTAPHPHRRRRKMKWARLDPAVSDATGTW
ncbi:MAG: hypothetical protein WAM82_20520, partial [Thermoanaerobaculia bacterium]